MSDSGLNNIKVNSPIQIHAMGLGNISDSELVSLKNELDEKLDEITFLSGNQFTQFDLIYKSIFDLFKEYYFILIGKYFTHIFLPSDIYQETLKFERRIFEEVLTQLTQIFAILKLSSLCAENLSYFANLRVDCQTEFEEFVYEANNLHPFRTICFNPSHLEIDNYLYYWTEGYKELVALVNCIIDAFNESNINFHIIKV